MKRFFATTLVLLSLGAGSSVCAGVVVVDSPSVTYTTRTPITAVFTDSNGNTYEQQVYYDPSLGGVDVSNSNNYTSVYFPVFGTGYLWYNGFWVGQDGYYWNNGARVYVGPTWNNYWNNHWHGGYNGWHNGWHDGWHDGWHGNDWHGGGWHGNDWHGDGWRGGGNEWRGGGGDWRGGGGDWHGGGGDWHGGGNEWRGGGHGGGEFHGGRGGGGEFRGGGGGGHRR